MPDHVHVLTYGAALDADFTAFVKAFKQRSGYWYASRFGRRLWQAGYYDRILRSDEATEAVARYVLENPIRAGLARELGEYPFAGSGLYEPLALTSAWDRQT